MIRSILVNGINLETKGKLQELDFLLKMHRFINKRGKLVSYIEEARIIIETLWFDPILSVEIDGGIMSVIPITDEGIYDGLVEIIYFLFFLEENPKKKKKRDPAEFDWI